MTISARWRLTTWFSDGDAYGVVIEDYHRG